MVGEPTHGKLLSAPANFNPKTHVVTAEWHRRPSRGGKDNDSRNPTPSMPARQLARDGALTDAKPRRTARRVVGELHIKPLFLPPTESADMSLSARPGRWRPARTRQSNRDTATAPDSVPVLGCQLDFHRGWFTGSWQKSATLRIRRERHRGRSRVSATCTDSSVSPEGFQNSVAVENRHPPRHFQKWYGWKCGSRCTAFFCNRRIRLLPSEYQGGGFAAHNKNAISLAADVKKYLESNRYAHLIRVDTPITAVPPLTKQALLNVAGPNKSSWLRTARVPEATHRHQASASEQNLTD